MSGSAITSLLQKSAIAAWIILAGSVSGLLWMMGDSKAPFELYSYKVEPVRPGEVLKLRAEVRRDLGRNCAVTFSRHMFDSAGTRLDLVGQTTMTAAALEQLNAIDNDVLRLAIPIPEYAEPGPAILVTPLVYQCNAWHGLRPIEYTMRIDFDISP